MLRKNIQKQNQYSSILFLETNLTTKIGFLFLPFFFVSNALCLLVLMKMLVFIFIKMKKKNSKETFFK
jgi:hypothetical protein